MKDIAVVPVKGLTDAKKRLANYLSPNERKKLVRAMLLDVLNALHESRSFTEVLVVSPDESLMQEAEQNHAVFLRQNGSGLNSAVQQATLSASHEDVSSITTVLADLPLLEPRDVEELVQISKQKPRVVLAPSLKGGTNVILRTPPDIIPTSYGRWSYAKHLRTAQKKGVLVYSISNSRLSFDVDTIDDLSSLRQLDSAERSSSGKLAKELGRLHSLARNT